MQLRYSPEQISRIIDQALVYQCACPAQVCRTILELRELYDYQKQCLERTLVDRQVHEAIAASTEIAHREYEACLERVLGLEGWDPVTLEMPATLRKQPLKT